MTDVLEQAPETSKKRGRGKGVGAENKAKAKEDGVCEVSSSYVHASPGRA